MKKLLILLCVLVLLVSCKTIETVYITPELPVFEPKKPIRPTLLSLKNDVIIPVEAVTNTTLLIGYIKELETYSGSWEAFYNELKEIYRNEPKKE